MPKHTKNLAPELIFELIEQLQIEASHGISANRFAAEILCTYIKKIPGVLDAQQPEIIKLSDFEIDVTVDNGNGITMQRFTLQRGVSQTFSLIRENGDQDPNHGGVVISPAVDKHIRNSEAKGDA